MVSVESVRVRFSLGVVFSAFYCDIGSIPFEGVGIKTKKSIFLSSGVGFAYRGGNCRIWCQREVRYLKVDKLKFSDVYIYFVCNEL